MKYVLQSLTARLLMRRKLSLSLLQCSTGTAHLNKARECTTYCPQQETAWLASDLHSTSILWKSIPFAASSYVHKHLQTAPTLSQYSQKHEFHDSARDASDSTAIPPVAERRPFQRKAHGIVWEDPYQWLAEASDSKVKKYLEDENAYAERWLAKTPGLQKSLEQEMKARLPPDEVGPPER